MRRAVAGLVLGVLVWLVLAGEAVAAQSAAPSHQSKARADAAGQLAKVSLPSSATEVSSDPSASSSLGKPPQPTGRYWVDDHRFWRVSENPSNVESWIKAHPPAGSNGSRGPRSASWPIEWGFLFPNDSWRVVYRSLVMEVTPASGGGSAVRADGLAEWVPPRPGWDRVPKTARRVTATLRLGGGRSRPVTFTTPASVGRIVRLVNHGHAIVPPPYPLHDCLGPKESFRLVFRARQGGPAIGRAGVFLEGCSFLVLSVGGRHGPGMDNAGEVAKALIQMGAVSKCSRQDLALKRDGISELHGEHTAQFKLASVGARSCEIDGRATVRLLGESGRPLPIPITYGKSLRPWVVGPRYPLWVAVTWRHSCQRRQVFTLRLSLAGLSPPFQVAVNQHHPFTPCRATVGEFVFLR